MNQQKIGQFLKELRKEKGLTQEQFAELLGVSSRSVSRWENGCNMPDLALLMIIANYYVVELSEVLNGERKSIPAAKTFSETEETALKVVEYTNTEKMRLTQRFHWILSLEWPLLPYIWRWILQSCPTSAFMKILPVSR